MLTRVLLRSAFSSEISSSLSRSCSRHALSSRVSVANSCRNRGTAVSGESGMETEPAAQSYRWDLQHRACPIQIQPVRDGDTKGNIEKSAEKHSQAGRCSIPGFPKCFGQGRTQHPNIYLSGLMSNNTRNCSTALEALDGI